MDIGDNWPKIRALFRVALGSCGHCALATVNDDGSPHVTPIGAIFLREDKTGFFFDENLRKSRQNLERDYRVCVLMVNADTVFWEKSLAEGRFESPPAVRLVGTVSEIREATEREMDAWRRRTAFAREAKGYEFMWGKMHNVRDIKFDSFEPLELGEMGLGLWL